MASKTFRDYQKIVDEWAQKLETPYWSPMSQFARLVEEVGELGRIYNHRHGDKIKKTTEEPDDFESEIGDILYSLLCITNRENIDLDRAMQRAIDKAQTRDRHRFPRKK